ncbi:hypothetical protein [Candidatus Doolittlea endobia]|uniref:hypothetical protein n=1 Tax=Candidatus Doolittlea endobia TaxID=1778262 RepID=UPI0038BA0611
MDWRIKTLHPKVHWRDPGRRNIDDAIMSKCDAVPIPFSATVIRAKYTREKGGGKH